MVAAEAKEALEARIPSQTLAFSSPPQAEVVFVPPFTPPTEEEQADSQAGGSRQLVQQCRHDPPGEIGLMALAPQHQIGLTMATEPTVFVYIPETSAQQLYVSLEAVEGEERYEGIVPVRGSEGIMALQLPLNGQTLALEQTYRWGVSLLCASGQTDMPWDQGYIQRVNATAELPGSPLESARILGQQGVWYDTLVALAEVQEQSQLRLQGAWAEMLNWANLEDLTTQSLLPTHE